MSNGSPLAMDPFHRSSTLGSVVGVVDRLPAPALHLLRRRAGVLVPAAVVPEDVAVRAGHPRQLRDRVGQQPQLLLALPQRRLAPLPLRDVGGPAVEQPLFRERFDLPIEPAVLPGLAPVAVLERDGFLAPEQSLALGLRRRPVVGVDEIQPGVAGQLLGGPAQHLLPGGVDPLEVAVEPGDYQHVGPDREEAVPLFLGPPAVHELPDLPCDGRHHFQQVGVRLPNLLAKRTR